jgi:hypothetical protein
MEYLTFDQLRSHHKKLHPESDYFTPSKGGVQFSRICRRDARGYILFIRSEPTSQNQRQWQVMELSTAGEILPASETFHTVAKARCQLVRMSKVAPSYVWLLVEKGRPEEPIQESLYGVYATHEAAERDQKALKIETMIFTSTVIK